MPDRRQILRGLAATLPLSMVRSAMGASPDAAQRFDAGLVAVRSDDADVVAARSYREFEFRESGPTDDELRARPSLAKKYSSEKAISQRAIDLIIEFEVSGETRYNQAYKSPIWPKGRSGVTIGVGYDLGYTSQDDFEAEWKGHLGAATIGRLKPACGVAGQAAEDLVAFFGDVVVLWKEAKAQFGEFLKLVSGETIHAFPESEALPSDAFGALVSLVYNRGGSTRMSPTDPLDRRREMRALKRSLAAGDLPAIPEQIRLMKRLWQNDPNARGLLRRRDLEADLFELGI